MTLEIISAQEILFTGEVELAQFPGTKGLFTVLPHHASLLSTLTPGVIEYVQNNQRLSINIQGGFVDIDNNHIAACIF